MHLNHPSAADLLASPIFAPLGAAHCARLADHLEIRFIPADEVVFRQGDLGDHALLVIDGEASVSLEDPELGSVEIGLVRRGELIGEIALLRTEVRTATVTARTSMEVATLSEAQLRRISAGEPEVRDALTELVERRLRRSSHVQERPGSAELVRCISSAELLCDLPEAALADVEARTRWLTMGAGDVLAREGALCDFMFLVIGGRLQLRPATGEPRDFGVGEILGADLLLRGDAFPGTVSAIRNSEVLALDRDGFERLAAAHPEFMRALFKRYTGGPELAPERRPAAKTFALILLRPDLRRTFARPLLAALGHYGNNLVVDQRMVRAALGLDPSGSEPVDQDALTRWVARMERVYDRVVLVAAADDATFLRAAVRVADQVLVATPSEDRASQLQFLRALPIHAPAELIVCHAGSAIVEGTSRWLVAQPFAGHHHVRLHEPQDFGRIARHLTGNAVGVVLGGGGARAFALLGALRALMDAGMPVDQLGGSGAGALIAALLASGRAPDAVLDLCAEGLVPRKGERDLLAFAGSNRGDRLGDFLRAALGEADLEDFIVPCFCSVTNLSRGTAEVRARGKAWRWAAASASLPLATQPRTEGDSLYVDGGVTNFAPADVMRRRNSGRVLSLVVAPARHVPVGAPTAQSAGFRALLFEGRSDGQSELEVALSCLTLHDRHAQARVEANSDWVLAPPADAWPLLDFRRIREIADAGFAWATSRTDGLASKLNVKPTWSQRFVP
jgi:NTE family protein